MKQLTLFILLMLLPMMASAESVEIDGIWYNLVSKTKKADVTKKPSGSYSGAIEIPEKVTYNGSEYSVNSIGEYAFYWCSDLTSITMPNSVTSIGECAFYWCSGLTSITIPNSVTSIGELAFYSCSSLTSIEIPKSVTSIGISAFDDCSGLTSVHITDLESWCKIAFGSNPLCYAQHLFLNGEEIKELVIPNSVTNIGSSAFEGCSGLTSVMIPNSVTNIGEKAFEYCFGLTSVTIPNSVTSIGYRTFYSCSGLTSITIPNSVTSIGDYAFLECTGLTSVNLGNSLTYVGGYAFYGCTGLTSVSIPNSVSYIYGNAFDGCSGLTSLTIGSGVNYIYSQAFANCEKLTDVYCLAEELNSTITRGLGPLSTDLSAFDGSYIEYATLHVPAASISAYQNIEPWKNFQKIVAIGDSEIPETQKCATPTIKYENGIIKFSCETEGVEFISDITPAEINQKYDSEIFISNTYKVTVYATKAGYNNSDKASIEIQASSGIKGDIDGDGKVNVADHVELTKIIMNE